MYRHIVMFKFREDVDSATREKIFFNFKKGIENLPSKISTIREIEVERNVNEDETWDICLNSLFDTLENIKSYGTNEFHQLIVKKLKPYLSTRACVDFVTEKD